MKRLSIPMAAGWSMAGALASAMLFVFPVAAQDSRLSLADRVARLEQAQSQAQGGTSLVNQVQQLQSQVQQQQGQIEELQHQLQQLDDKNKAQYTDLDSRLGKLESGGAATGSGQAGNPAPPQSSAPAAGSAAGAAQPPSAAAGNGTPPADPAAAQAAYDAAFKSLRAGDYVQASRGFRSFIQQYPDSTLTPNAYYWLGESYYVTMNYPVALESFQRLLSQFPQSDKAPDATLKLGYTQYELKQTDAAKATLQSVVAKYPGSKAAGLAKERLSRLQSPVN